MRGFGKAAREWARDRRAEGIVHALQRSADRPATLTAVQNWVDDRVLSGMLDLSYAAAATNDDQEDALAWADLAVQASLLGGTAAGRADALLLHATLLCDLAAGRGDRRQSLHAAIKNLDAATLS